MRKILCDVCGKEQTKPVAIGMEVKLWSTYVTRTLNGKFQILEQQRDLCEDCSRDLEAYIETKEAEIQEKKND